MHEACREGHLDVVQVLVNEFKSKSVNKAGLVWTHSVQPCLSSNGHLSIAQFLLPLLEPGGVESRDRLEMTALHNAAMGVMLMWSSGWLTLLALTSMLLTRTGCTPLHWAADGDHEVEQRIQDHPAPSLCWS